jgi:polyisoprenoid-binding protein YceI
MALVIIVGIVAYLVWVYGGDGSASATQKGSVVAATVAPTVAPTLTPATGQTIFTIDSSKSPASFTTHEVFLGSDKTVVGTTSGNAVSGQILIDLSDPQKSLVGEIKVDVSTLATDNDMRNNTLQGRILETGDSSNQYATFVATSYSGLPSSIGVGQTVTFKVAGNLTVHSVTKPETFTVMLTEVNSKQVTGTATAIVPYADFGMSIPNVTQVSDVSNDVTLTLDYTADA